MCPACIASAAWIVASAASVGGLTALTWKKFRAQTGAEIVNAAMESTIQTIGEQDATENRVMQ